MKPSRLFHKSFPHSLLIPSGLPSWILTCTELSGHWRLLVLVLCARLSWSHSAFESTLNSSIVSYPKLVVMWLCRLLTGLKITDLSSAKEAMRRLLETGVKTVVISSTDLGSQSSLLALASTVTGNRFTSLNMDNCGTLCLDCCVTLATALLASIIFLYYICMHVELL